MDREKIKQGLQSYMSFTRKPSCWQTQISMLDDAPSDEKFLLRAERLRIAGEILKNLKEVTLENSLHTIVNLDDMHKSKVANIVLHFLPLDYRFGMERVLRETAEQKDDICVLKMLKSIREFFGNAKTLDAQNTRKGGSNELLSH